MRHLTAFLAAALLACTVSALAVPAQAVDVGAGGDRYSGTGGLLLPAGTDPGTRRQASECSGCRWTLSDPCAADGGPCLAITRGCAQLASLLRIRLSLDGGATWSDRGLVCIPPAGPITVDSVARELQQRFDRLVPALAPAREPPTGIVTRIPVNFLSGQPAGLSPSSHDILGRAVLLRPVVRWAWEFGDGATRVTADPGSAYPLGSIRHAYRRAGTYLATVRATWSGTFEVDGLGPFPVAGAIDQQAVIEVPVGEGRAVLVP